MKGHVGTIVLSLVCGVLIASTAQAAPRVYARVETTTDIYPGDSFVYSIVVEGGSKPSHVDTSPIAQYSPRGPSTQSIVSDVNGRMTASYKLGYSIAVSKPGPIRLPSLTVTVDGKQYRTNPVQITVSTPGTTDKLEIELSLSQKECYVGQPIVMTVNWTIKVPVRNASFSLPVFQTGDFFIENPPGSEQAYAQTTHRIHDVPVVLTENRRTVDGLEIAILSFKKILIPKRSGQIVLDPATVSTEMAVGRKRTGSWINPVVTEYKRFAVNSQPVELNVSPLPDAGKPAGFYGLVGSYSISASATPTKVNVGDPITLTIRIGGSHYLKPVQWPALEQVPGLAENFRIPSEKASPVLADGSKVFTQTIRANNDAVTQIPPIPLAHFDPRLGQYAVAQTKPIPLGVSPTKVLSGADVEGRDFRPVNREVEAIKRGLSANYDDLDALKDQTFSPLATMIRPSYLLMWLLPLVALASSVATKAATSSTPQKLASRRRRRASVGALKELKAIGSLPAEQRPERLAMALKGYVADRLDRTAGSLTAEDCRQVIAAATKDQHTADRLADMVSQCEAARYAALDANVDDTYLDQAEELIRAVEKRA